MCIRDSRNGVVPTEKIPPRQLTPVELSVHEFEHYLRNERSLSEKTIVYYVPFVHRFLTDRFGDGPVTLSRLTAADVVRFVQRQDVYKRQGLGLSECHHITNGITNQV